MGKLKKSTMSAGKPVSEKRTGAKTSAFSRMIEKAHLVAQRKAFRNNMPVAISQQDGKVMLVYPDKRVEEATPEKLKALEK